MNTDDIHKAGTHYQGVVDHICQEVGERVGGADVPEEVVTEWYVEKVLLNSQEQS